MSKRVGGKYCFSTECGKFRREIVFKKPPDFINYRIWVDISSKNRGICSRNQKTFSLTVWCYSGEIKKYILFRTFNKSSERVIIWIMDMRGHPQPQINRILAGRKGN